MKPKSYYKLKKCLKCRRMTYIGTNGKRCSNCVGEYRNFKRTPLSKVPVKRKKCVFCSCKEKERLVLHHIDRNPEINIEDNLICVCHNCHALIHYRIYKRLEKVGLLKRYD
jgi:hypothetical protein